MSTGTVFLACRREQTFGMSTETTRFWHVDGNKLLACRRRQFFGMSTGTTLLACRRYFWHVDASYPIFNDLYIPVPMIHGFYGVVTWFMVHGRSTVHTSPTSTVPHVPVSAAWSRIVLRGRRTHPNFSRSNQR